MSEEVELAEMYREQERMWIKMALETLHSVKEQLREVNKVYIGSVREVESDIQELERQYALTCTPEAWYEVWWHKRMERKAEMAREQPKVTYL